MIDGGTYVLAGFVRLTDHGFALPIYQGAGGGNACYVAQTAIVADRSASIVSFEQFDGPGFEMLEEPLRREVVTGDPWLDIFLWKNRVLVGERHELIGELDESLAEIAESAPLTAFDLSFDLGMDDVQLVANAAGQLSKRFGPDTVRQIVAETLLSNVARLRVRRWAHSSGSNDCLLENDLALVRHYPFDLALALADTLRERLEHDGRLSPLIGELRTLAAAANLTFFDGIADPQRIVPSPTPTRDRRVARRQADFRTLTEALDYAALGVRGLNFTDPRGGFVKAYSFTDLRRDALANAARLQANGIKTGDRVGLIAEACPEFAALFFGCLYIGALPVPLALPTSFGGKDAYSEQLALQLSSSGAKLVLCGRELLELADAGARLALAEAWDWVDFSAGPAPSPDLPNILADTTCFLQYSSGSTRIPRGVMISHRNVLSNLSAQAKALQLNDDDRYVSWLPWYHDSGLVGCLLSAVANQVSADFLATEDFARRPLAWLDMISRVDGYAISFAPSFGYDICSRRVSSQTHVADRFDLGRWRVAGNSSDMVRSAVMRSFNEAFADAGFSRTAFLPTYGLTEATLVVSMMPLDEGIVTEPLEASGALEPSDIEPNFQRHREIVNCGKAVANMRIEIRNAVGTALGGRRLGRIWCAGPAIMQGYDNDAESDFGTIVDGWLDTGDVGYLANEYLYVVGRAKDVIVVNGKQRWSQDIEWEVEQLPGFKSGDIAAFSTSENNGEEVVTILVQCRTSDGAERLKLRNEVIERVRRLTGLNAHVELVPPRTLPRTATGKLNRFIARNLYLSGEIQPFEIPDEEAA